MLLLNLPNFSRKKRRICLEESFESNLSVAKR